MSKKLFLLFIFVLACLFVSLSLRAQFISESVSVAEPVAEAAPDSIVQLTAEAQGLTLVPSESLPRTGTFWVVTSNGLTAPFPCPPRDEVLPTYGISGDIFLVDDTAGQVNLKPRRFQIQTTSDPVAAALEQIAGSVVDLIGRVQQMEFEQTMAMAFGFEHMEAEGSGGGSYGSNDLLSGSVDYGTNLWIARTAVTNHFLTGIGSNTLADVQYEIQSRTNLAQMDWQSEGFILGSALTNWTPLSVAQNNRTNLFLRLRSWADDGSGLPLWWQQQYFGTNGVDAFGDPDGDGWSNWEEFKNGTSPIAFNTPPQTQGFMAKLNPTNLQVTLNWQPARGAVIGYTIGRFHLPTWIWTYFSVGLTNQFVDTNYPAYSPTDLDLLLPDRYEIQANYANGDSSPWTSLSTSPYPWSDATAVLGMPGENYALKLLVTHIPPDAVSLRLIRFNSPSGYQQQSNAIFADYPASAFSGGAFNVPTNMAFNGGIPSSFQMQVLRANGEKSVPVYAGTTLATIFYGSVQMEQNVAFLVRAAGLSNSLTYMVENNLTRQPTNYAYSGIYNVYTGNYSYSGLGEGAGQNWPRPLDDHYRYRNLLYASTTNLNSDGSLNTGCSINNTGTYVLPTSRVFKYQTPTNGGSIPALLQSTYAPPYRDFRRLGMTTNFSSQFVLPGNLKNIFGLRLSSVLAAHNHAGALYLDTLSAGGTLTKFTNDTYYFYPQFDQPQMQTTGYYFARIDGDYTAIDSSQAPVNDFVPGNAGFSPNNAPPLLIGGMDGLYLRFAAFAKKIISNGDTNKPVYVGQYFDKAYVVDANGNITTNSAGVLSPLGDFMPTIPGPVALVTQPDIYTGQRGTGIVQIVSLALDANHDGAVDSTYFGPDPVTAWNSEANTFKFWLNNGFTQPGQNGQLDRDLPVYPNQAGYNGTNIQPNYLYGKIRSQRNLENFARLHICGLPQFPANQGYSVTLSMDFNWGAGMNLYAACETNGGIGYLTDTNIAARQISTGSLSGHTLDFNTRLAELGFNDDYVFDPYTVPLDNGHPWLTNFLFEGSYAGEHYLLLTVLQSNNIVAQATAMLSLDDVKNFYEQATVTNVVQAWPEMVQTTNISGFQVTHTPDESAYEDKEAAVFVHGWRMTQYDYEKFSDTMFKRLYWQGFNGRFASLRWPTRSQDTDTNTIAGIPSDMLTFDRSEHIAFKSGTGAAAYFNDLRSRFPDDSISACAHSMGNIVMMQALKELAASNQAPLDNYILMQAAVSASCYDTTLPSLTKFTNPEQLVPTPNTYSGYAAGIDNALRGKVINFFNTNDYALATASTNVSVPIFGGYYISTTMGLSWEDNQLITKPLLGFGYKYNATNSTATLTNVPFGVSGRLVTDPRELMPFVARTRTKAVGAQPGVGQMVNGGEVDLSPFGFTKEVYDHSGQFNRNMQAFQSLQFYTNLVSKMFPQ